MDTVKRILKKKSFFLIFGAAFSYLCITSSSFAYLGFAISFALLASLVFLTKRSKILFTRLVYISILSFCVFLVFRSQGFLTFLNMMAIVYMGSVMIITSDDQSSHLSFLRIILSPFIAIFGSARQNDSDYFSNSKEKQKSELKSLYIFNVLKSLVLSGFLLSITLPLLASANPFFSKWVDSFYNLFNLSFILRFFDTSNLFIWLIRIVFTALLYFFVSRSLLYAHKQKDAVVKALPTLLSVPLSLPKIIISFVLAFFFVTQLQLYFSSNETLVALGYTNSKYAQEIFAQLCIVAAIVVGLIYNDKSTKKTSRLLTYILFFEAVFLTLIALKSVSDYSINWGLTYKRLWGITGVFWLFGALSVFSYIYYKKLTSSHFVKCIILLSSATLFLVNIANFDYLIFHFSKATTGDGIDYNYLSSLSSDSQSFREQFQTFEKLAGQSTPEFIQEHRVSALSLHRKIKTLKTKYANLDIRTFNVSEFKEYTNVKDLDLDSYYEKWKYPDVTQPKLNSSSSNRFDRFPLRRNIPILSPTITYFYVNSPSDLKVTITNRQIADEHWLIADIWNQAGINFLSSIQSVSLSNNLALAVRNGDGDKIAEEIKPQINSLPVFIVKSIPGSPVGWSSFTNDNKPYLYITESIFENIDGRELAKLIGSALGVNQTNKGGNYNGLMGNMNNFDISEADIQTVRMRLQALYGL